jgi:hypothetical protein
VFVSGWTKLSGKTKWLHVSSLSKKNSSRLKSGCPKPEKTKDLEHPPIPRAFRPSAASNWLAYKSGRVLDRSRIVRKKSSKMDSSFGFGRGFAWVETAMPFLTKRFYLEILVLSILTARPKLKPPFALGVPVFYACTRKPGTTALSGQLQLHQLEGPAFQKCFIGPLVVLCPRDLTTFLALSCPASVYLPT